MLTYMSLLCTSKKSGTDKFKPDVSYKRREKGDWVNCLSYATGPVRFVPAGLQASVFVAVLKLALCQRPLASCYVLRS